MHAKMIKQLLPQFPLHYSRYTSAQGPLWSIQLLTREVLLNLGPKGELQIWPSSGHSPG